MYLLYGVELAYISIGKALFSLVLCAFSFITSLFDDINIVCLNAHYQ